MELLLKTPSDELPRLAVKYVYEFQAVRAYEELVSGSGDSPLHATAEIAGTRMILNLKSDYNGKMISYRDLEFRAADIQRLERIRPPFLFVHIFPQHNTLLVAKPFRKAKFLQIISFSLVGSGQEQL